MSSPHSDSYESHARKRVGKACDRCRLKKSKCDGSNPCSRCKADNAICVFGERKKSQDKVYPKGYVEMLEQQQHQMVGAIREMYQRLQRGEQWPGEELKEYDGYPLTHDILERLGVLHMVGDNPTGSESFEDDLEALQQRLMVENGVSYSRQRRSSPGSDSEPGLAHSDSLHSTPVMRQSTVSYSRKRASPITPPLDSPELVLPSKHQRYSAPISLEAEPLQNWSEPFVMGSPDTFNFTALANETPGMYDASTMADLNTMAPVNSMTSSMPMSLNAWDSDWESFLRSGVNQTGYV